MTVTGIEQITKTRFRIYIDERPSFVLYRGELTRYHIEVGEEIAQKDFREIRDEIIPRRAKLRAMHLLNDMDRTEEELREKLRRDGYSGETVDAALQYVKSFGYVNDEKYAQKFIESRRRKKSRREIRALLLRKGISSQTVEYYGEDDPKRAIEDLLRKKHFDPSAADAKEREKICGYLARKGFRYEEIRQVILFYDRNT